MLVLVNVVWSFYYQQAYREDTYEVADLTKRLIERGYFEQGDKIYFEMTEGYYDIYPLQVISMSRGGLTPILSRICSAEHSLKKTINKKRTDDEQSSTSLS